MCDEPETLDPPMKAESLEALIIDWHSGELSPEAEELLEHHLAGSAAARAEAERLRAVLGVMTEAVRRHPELGRPEAAGPVREVRVAGEPAGGWRMTTRWVRAAMALLAAGLAAVVGYRTGRMEFFLPAEQAAPGRVTAESPEKTEVAAGAGKAGPWARYRVATNPAGAGLQVVRVETAVGDAVERRQP